MLAAFKKITTILVLLSNSSIQGTLIIIHGTSCAGKSTLNKHLTELLRQDNKNVSSFSIDKAFIIAGSPKLNQVITSCYSSFDSFTLGFFLFNEEFVHDTHLKDHVIVDHYISEKDLLDNLLHI